jgi:hypothetical protein
MAGSKSFHDLVEALNKKRKTEDDPDRFDGKPDDGEVDFYGHQRADGEQAFRAAHKKQVHDEPEAAADVASADKNVTQSQKQGASLGRDGEKTRVTQGTSKTPAGNPQGKTSISAFTAQTPLRRGDADNHGDISPVVLSPSSVNPKKAGMVDFLPSVAKVNAQTGDREVLRTSPSAVQKKSVSVRKAFTQFKEELETPAVVNALSAFDIFFNNPNDIRECAFESGENCVIDIDLAEMIRGAFDLLDEENQEHFVALMNESIESFTTLVQFIAAEMGEE